MSNPRPPAARFIASLFLGGRRHCSILRRLSRSLALGNSPDRRFTDSSCAIPPPPTGLGMKRAHCQSAIILEFSARLRITAEGIPGRLGVKYHYRYLLRRRCPPRKRPFLGSQASASRRSLYQSADAWEVRRCLNIDQYIEQGRRYRTGMEAELSFLELYRRDADGYYVILYPPPEIEPGNFGVPG